MNEKNSVVALIRALESKGFLYMSTDEGEYGTFVYAMAPEGKTKSKRWVAVRLDGDGKVVLALVNCGLHASGRDICIVWDWGWTKPKKNEYEDYDSLAVDLLEEVELSRSSIHYIWTDAYYGKWTPHSELFPLP